MTSTYIETGARIRVYDSTVQTHNALPVGTYRVHYDTKEGFSLLKMPDLAVGGTVYGAREQKVKKILTAYDRTERSLGVMLSGDKGQGKSLFVRMLSEAAIARQMPVVLVTEDADGIADFLDTLDECLIIFDEFEKTFEAPTRRSSFDGPNRQNQFLSLFDGISTVKRIYCLTVNDVMDVSPYIVNRPGRFHYHMRFDYPGPDDVRRYLSDEAPLAAQSEIDSAVLFSRRVRLNYDHLRAIAFEINDPAARFSDCVGDLNIKAIEPSEYRIEAKFADGKVFADEAALNLFERGNEGRTVELRHNQESLFFSFLPRDLVFEDDGSIYIPSQKMDILDEDEEPLEELPVSVSLALVGQASYAYDGF